MVRIAASLRARDIAAVGAGSCPCPGRSPKAGSVPSVCGVALFVPRMQTSPPAMQGTRTAGDVDPVTWRWLGSSPQAWQGVVAIPGGRRTEVAGNRSVARHPRFRCQEKRFDASECRLTLRL